MDHNDSRKPCGNCILGFAAYRLDLPLYLDTAGTIGVTLIAGPFPGIATGVLTNMICGVFNPNAAYYSFISALTAVLTGWLQQRYKSGGRKMIAMYILTMAFLAEYLEATEDVESYEPGDKIEFET